MTTPQVGWFHAFVVRQNGDTVLAEVYHFGTLIPDCDEWGWTHPYEQDVRLIDLAKAWKRPRFIEQADGSIVEQKVSPGNDKEDTK